MSRNASLNEDLDEIDNWTYHWKMSFNPDPSKKAQEVSSKSQQCITPSFNF